MVEVVDELQVLDTHLKGWVMTLARWSMLKKLGTYAMCRRRPAIFSVTLQGLQCCMSYAPCAILQVNWQWPLLPEQAL